MNYWLLAFDIIRLIAAILLIVLFFFNPPLIVTIVLLVIVGVGLVSRAGKRIGQPNHE